MIKLDYINEFLVLAETKSFSKAAEQLFITQSSLSRHIAILEEEMGGKLIARTTHSVHLTPSGESVIEKFRMIRSEMQYAKEKTLSLSTGKSGFLRLSVPYYWMEDYIEPVMDNFLSKHPDCEVKVSSCQPLGGMEEIENNQSDILLWLMVGDISDEIRRVPFAKEPIVSVVRSDHPLAERNSIHFSDLQGFDLVSLMSGDRLMDTLMQNADQFLIHDSITFRNTYYSQQVDTIGMDIKRTGAVSIDPAGVRHMERSYLKYIPVMK